VKKLTIIRFLVTGSCILSGLLAGGNVYRYIIEVPAWHNLNINMWSRYSEHADLGNGLFLFPIEAVGSTVLLIISSAIYFGDTALKPVAWPLYVSAS
jgi:hypothetical protein